MNSPDLNNFRNEPKPSEEPYRLSEEKWRALMDWRDENTNERDDWFDLLGSGVIDQFDGVWVVDNVRALDRQPGGWRVGYCRDDSSAFVSIPIDGVNWCQFAGRSEAMLFVTQKGIVEQGEIPYGHSIVTVAMFDDGRKAEAKIFHLDKEDYLPKVVGPFDEDLSNLSTEEKERKWFGSVGGAAVDGALLSE